MAQRHSESLDGWWHTWFDERAPWQEEAPLPPATPLGEMPCREPTVGWERLEEGMEALPIPGTWEAARPGYCGVAWHWRPFVVPREWEARRVHLRFEGARLRAEVYLDRRLVGYNLDGATPFEIEITPYVRPDRRHELALRVTNPGGWRDPSAAPIHWAGRTLPAGPDVGGVWGGVTLIGRPDPYLYALTVFPSADGAALSVRVEVANSGGAVSAMLRCRALTTDGTILAETEQPFLLARGERRREATLPVATASRWSPETPNLLLVQTQLTGPAGTDDLAAWTGRRTAELSEGGWRLNGQECRPLGLDVLAPPQGPLRPDQLAAADRLGRLTAQTMGLDLAAGRDPLYAELARQRIERLVWRDGAHPSLVAWHLGAFEESAGPDQDILPLLTDWLALLRGLDPSRPILWGSSAGRLMGLDPRSGSLGTARPVVLH